MVIYIYKGNCRDGPDGTGKAGMQGEESAAVPRFTSQHGGKNMERQAVIRDLSAEIDTLARLHIQHGLHHTKGFANQKRNIEKLIQDNEVNLKKELDPLVLNLYRRYFG